MTRIGWRALREVLGLVVLRQAALWTDWRPWLAIVGVVLPLGIMLSHASRAWARPLWPVALVMLWPTAYILATAMPDRARRLDA